GVEHILNYVRAAVFVGEPRGADAAGDVDAFLFGDDLGDCNRDCGIVAVDHHVHALRVEPPAYYLRTDIWLVLMIGVDNIHVPAEHLATEIRHGHARRLDRPHAADIR